MHGRVKVRTSEEEKARKQKERQEKLRLFQHAMGKIQEKRKLAELDKELLDITGQVLVSNPDIYTLWNIRREILELFRNAEATVDELKKLFDDELNLTEYCLKINPKSYCAWHQRQWILLARSDRDWKKELGLCDKYLKLDERNFHTWDHRRFVVSNYNPPLKEEFDFTTEKIHENFSNYSAWHYRSKMLVELYPDLKTGRPIEDVYHKRELELVQSAAFTDPDDTSAWFYQRWLLGAVKETTHLVVCTVAPTKITLAFNKFISRETVSLGVQITANKNALSGAFESATGNQNDNLWIFRTECEIKHGLEVQVTFVKDGSDVQEICCTEYSPAVYIGKAQVSFGKQYAEAVDMELKKQIVSCKQLLDLEPENRWTLLTTTVFQHCIDPVTYHNETIENLNTLIKLDSQRAGYYKDMKTKWSLENQIVHNYNEHSRKMEVKFDGKISSLPHLQYYSYCDTVDLSNQNLTHKNLPALVMLQHCKVLNLENNQLVSLAGFPSLQLKSLNIRGNKISQNKIEEFKKKVNFEVLF